MARSLNKKYFGNRNIGTTGTTDNYGIGGEGVVSAAITVAGSYTTNRPAFTFAAPQFPTGVTATGTITSEVLSAAIGGSQTRAYSVAAGAISFAGGTSTATFTATVTSSGLTTVARASTTTLGFDTTTTAMISGTSIHITGASITGSMSIGGTAIAAGQIYYVGAPTAATTATLYASYSDAVTATSPLTIVAGSGVTGATFTRGVTYGTVTSLTPVNRGVFAALVTGSQAAVSVTYGAGLTITPTYRANSVVITEKGSGYTAAPAIAGYTNQGGVTVATVALTTDSGDVGSSTNQENAIIMTAFLTGGSALTVDIIRQVSGRRYKVTDGTRTGIVKLVAKANGSLLAGECNIIATDAATATYYVTKLTNHKATLTRNSGTVYTNSAATQWTFGAATATVCKIPNA